MFTVVGGVHEDPDDANSRFKDIQWDDEASIHMLRATYAVSIDTSKNDPGY